MDSLEYFISTCTKSEEQFQNEFKKNYPVYLEDVHAFFNTIESEDLCDSVFGVPTSLKNQGATGFYRFTPEICKTSYNGICNLRTNSNVLLGVLNSLAAKNYF